MNASDLSCTSKELDELTRLELNIARRADELTRSHNSPHSTQDCWLEAEREIWSAWLFAESARVTRQHGDPGVSLHGAKREGVRRRKIQPLPADPVPHYETCASLH
jgi:hypothetical protein